MNIGDKVSSRLYADLGVGTILSFSDLFGEEYVEVLFSDNKRVSTKLSDLSSVETPLTRLCSGAIDTPQEFMVRNLSLRLEQNLTDKKLIGSSNYKIQPLPHQLLTVNFVMNRFQPRCLIADEVGLGKTIEAILVYQEYKLRGMANRVLIVAPSGLVLQWHEELLTKFNEQFIIYNKEYVRTLKQSYGEETNVWTKHDKIIVSIDSIKPMRISSKLEKAELKKREWHNKHIADAVKEAGFDVVIFDEAHRLSKKGDGLESARYKLGKELSEAVPVLLLLTATPHQGDEGLFHNLMKLVDPVMFADGSSLTPSLIKEVAVRNQKRAVVDFEGNRIFKHRITNLVEIQRTVADNQDELLLYELVTEYTSKHYDRAMKDKNKIFALLVMLYQRIVSSSSFAVLSTMERRLAHLQNSEIAITSDEALQVDEDEVDIEEILSQGTIDPELLSEEIAFLTQCIEYAKKVTTVYGDAKLQKLIEIVDELKVREDNPELKFIIFTEFRGTQEAIIEFLHRFGYTASYINGGLSREEKAEQVQLFREKNQILVSTDAGGEGINLQFCYCLINYDLPWNPSRLEQRIGRVDRIGQKHNALIFNFQLTNTVEDDVRVILETKLDVIKEQFGDDKYKDVLALLQEEFSFDRIYVDAIKEKDKESKALDAVATQIFNRAKEVIEEDELLIPFNEFDTEAKELVNYEVNSIIENLVCTYLQVCGIELSRYSENRELLYFTEPFEGSKKILRYQTFNASLSSENDKYELINIEHPIVKMISHKYQTNERRGAVSAFTLDINKFGGITGYWFAYKLNISNNRGKQKTALITIFMEDENFANNRVGTYLSTLATDSISVIQNYSSDDNLELISTKAFSEAQKKANDIFLSTKLDWFDEFDNYESRLEDYYKLKCNAYKSIKLDNIRESKLFNLEKNRIKEKSEFDLKRNIIPKLELIQLAFVEFV